MKRKLVAVIGGGNAGKSTIIQSLTGCPTRTFCGRVRDSASAKEIEVLAASPQERNISTADLRRMLKDAAERPNSTGMVIAMRPSRSRKRQSMENVFLLASEYGLSASAFLIAPGYKNAPSQTDVNETLGRLAASNVPVQRLNGERFAHINASIIRDTAGLF